MIYQKLSRRQKLAMLWWTQPKFKDRDALICDGSVRSGKSVSMTVGFILWSMSHFDKQKFAICGKTIGSLRRNIILNLRDWLPQDFQIVEKRAENKIVITTAGRSNAYFLFGGTDESSYMLIQGITLAGVLMDEVALMPRSFVEQACARCSVSGSKFWFNCNPEGPEHWFYKEWIEGDRVKAHNALHLHFTMDDNLALDPDVRVRYERMYSGVFYRRYIQGLWVKAEGLVYPMFDRETHVVHTFPQFSQRHRYYVAIDYGTVNPFAAGLYDYSPADQRAVMLREFYHKGGSVNRMDNEGYYKKLVELIGDYPIEYIIIDPSAASMIETIQKYGEYMVVKADNDVLNGIQDVTKFLNAGALAFHSSCKDTFKEFDLYSWDEDSQEDAVIKENDHSMDQLRYFCRTALRNELKWIV